MSIKILVWKESVSEMEWMCNCPRNQSINQSNNPANIGWNDEWICGAIYIFTYWHATDVSHAVDTLTIARTTFARIENKPETFKTNVFHEHTKSWAINIEWTTTTPEFHFSADIKWRRAAFVYHTMEGNTLSRFIWSFLVFHYLL